MQRARLHALCPTRAARAAGRSRAAAWLGVFMHACERAQVAEATRVLEKSIMVRACRQHGWALSSQEGLIGALVSRRACPTRQALP